MPGCFWFKNTKRLPDRDGDGIPDKDVPGPKTNAGCPFQDTDEDGVIDLIDSVLRLKALLQTMVIQYFRVKKLWMS